MSSTPSLEVTCLAGNGLKKAGSFLGGQDPYVKLYLADQEYKTKPHKGGGDRAEWNEACAFDGVAYGDVLKISVRNQKTMSRSIIGENVLMIDRFFDGKEVEEVVPVYSDAEQLNKSGEVVLRFVMRLGETAAAAVAEATEAQKQFAAAKEEMSVEKAEAVEALKGVTFTGPWNATLTFHVVDLGAGEVAGVDVSTFKAAGATKRVGGGALRTKADVVPGAVAPLALELQKKGGSYFKGTSTEFPPFGKEGNVTGSLQRMSGKVNMQVQLKNSAGVTTSFNLVGHVTVEGVYQGTFSGCEISRNAGSVSGTFKMVAGDAPPGEGGAPAEGTAAAAAASS